MIRPNPNEVLDIHIPKFTRMVAENKASAFLICGDSGVGKSFGVEKTLKQCEKEFKLKWMTFGGGISAIGLYRTLFKNRHGVIVFDDIDSVFSARGTADLLKNALNSKSSRKVDYIKNNPNIYNAYKMDDEDKEIEYIASKGTAYPNSFIFNGGCIAFD